MKSNRQAGRLHQDKLQRLAQQLYPERVDSSAGHFPNGSIQEEDSSHNLRRRTIATMENEPAEQITVQDSMRHAVKVSGNKIARGTLMNEARNRMNKHLKMLIFAVTLIAATVQGQLQFCNSSTNLPSGTVGQFYNPLMTNTICAEGASGIKYSASGNFPSSWSVVQNLPAIWGTPTTATTYHFTITLTDAVNQTTNMSFSLTVNPQPLPSVQTLAASSIGVNSATLNSSVNPNGATTTIYFQYGLTTSYGSTSSTESIGTVSGNYGIGISGLSAGATYHFRVVAYNSGGTNYGSDLTFMTSNQPPPTVTTLAAGSITTNSATLNLSVNPNGASTTVYFQYGLTTSYGSTTFSLTDITNSQSYGIGTSTVLSPNTPYHFRAVAYNSGGTNYGGDLTFTTLSPQQPPTVTTGTASPVSTTSATLNGTVNPNGNNIGVYFDWGTNTNNYNNITSGYGESGSSSIPIAIPISGLSPNTIYYFRIGATIDGGGTYYGNSVPFTTANVPPPTVTTTDVTGNSGNSATANGTVNPNGSATSCYFNWGTTTAYGLTTPVVAVGSGTSTLSFSAPLSTLSPDSTYHYQMVAYNSGGTNNGGDVSFTTVTQSATTGTATPVSPTSETLNGTVSPNGWGITANFEWGTTTAYGNTAPGTPWTESGTGTIPLATTLTGLSPNTTYHYKMVTYITAFPFVTAGGNDQTFTTQSPSTPPTIAITSPTSGSTYSTSSSTINLGGTAGANDGIAKVTWSNSQAGNSGTASGTTSWTANSISLNSGANVITVTAYDNAGNTSTATLTVTYTITPTAPTYTISISEQTAAGSINGVNVYAYNLQNGGVVTTGSASYIITQNGSTISSGPLTYSSESQSWHSGTLTLSGSGTFTVMVTINGQVQSNTFSVASPTVVPLYGVLEYDNGTEIPSATLVLFNYSIFLGVTFNPAALPTSVAQTTSQSDGSFTFGPVAPGGYIIAADVNGVWSPSPVFWIPSGVTIYNEILTVNWGQNELLDGLSSLQSVIQTDIINQQTTWMQSVCGKVDSDLDTSPDQIQQILFLAGLVTGFENDLGQEGTQTALNTAAVSATEQYVLPLAEQGIQSSYVGQAATSLSGLGRVNLAYGETSSGNEMSEADSAFKNDFLTLVYAGQPQNSSSFFSRNNGQLHLSVISNPSTLQSYEFAQNWLASYYSDAQNNLPTSPSSFDVSQAVSVEGQASDELQSIANGTAQIFISPNPYDANPGGPVITTLTDPLLLNLGDFYTTYMNLEQDWNGANAASETLSGIGIAANTYGIYVAAAGVVSGPGAAIAEPAAGAIEAVGAVANVAGVALQVEAATLQQQMLGTFVNLASDYSGDLLTCPLVLKRTGDFFISEAKSPYYFDSENQFAGDISGVSLPGAVSLFGDTYYPTIDFNILPGGAPLIQFTTLNSANVSVSVPSGNYSEANYRVEAKVIDSLGVHDHTVLFAGSLGPGGSTVVSVPFIGYLPPNGFLSGASLETRLWTGPFQGSLSVQHFYVMQFSSSVVPGVGLLSATRKSTENVNDAAERTVTSVTTVKRQTLSVSNLLALADQLVGQSNFSLSVGSNTVDQSYTFSNTVFLSQFKLYKQFGPSVIFRVENGTDYVGWDPATSTIHYGFPAQCTGPGADPQIITVPNCGGQTLTLHTELASVPTGPVNVISEVWEQPVRDAVMAVLPNPLNLTMSTNATQTVSLAIGENSQQQPINGLAITLSPLTNAANYSLTWSNVSPVVTSNVLAGGIYMFSAGISSFGAPSGTYTGAVTVSSSNAGTIQVPVVVNVNAPQLLPGSLQVTITPTNAAEFSAQWQLNGGALQNSGAIVTNLPAGTYLLSFGPALGWTPPSDLFVTITNGETTITNGNYTASSAPTNGLVLLTNGSGTIQHAAWRQGLTPGNKYMVTAVPKARNLFVSWIGGASSPYSLLSTNASYSFNYEPGLLLEANFVTNPFVNAAGNYLGLFAPENTNRSQTNSGSFNFTLSSAGAVSGNIHVGFQTVPLNGKFEPDGSAQIISKRRGANNLTTSLQLDLVDQTVNGTVTDGSFVAQLAGYQNVFNSRNKATNYEGHYTLIVLGTTNSTNGPFGTSYGTATVSETGNITFVGSLADNTIVSQSSVVSQSGYWPFYVPLYGGKGSIWAWNYFTNGTLATNFSVSWINATNSAKTAAYRSGFTNQEGRLMGGLYLSKQALPAGLIVILQGSNLPAITITNLSENTNHLTLKTNKTTGVISGSFVNPAEPSQIIKFSGVILQGQTNAQGYFLGTNQSGAFLLDSP